MVTYYELGKHKQLNEIVIAGSHDAGITGGGKNVQTQSLDILGQATAGVRIFDLRIAAATAGGKVGAHKGAELKAFHADGKLMKNESKLRHVGDVGRVENITRTKLKGGAFGLGLTKILEDAGRFLETETGRKEFLILKFDKCLNWPLIAEACITVLGDRVYTDGGNLNTTQLKALKGKVVVVFSLGGVNALGGALGPKDGILGFKNLFDKSGGAAYTRSFEGLQYYGKGGTSVAKPFGKLGQNEKKQGKLMDGAKLLGSPEVMGMMYWTTTGMFESIKKRNAQMWDPPKIARLKKLWAQGLQEFVVHSNPLSAPPGSVTEGALRKRFMPNIVMIDFADEFKCQQIRDLNDLTAEQLAAIDN